MTEGGGEMGDLLTNIQGKKQEKRSGHAENSKFVGGDESAAARPGDSPSYSPTCTGRDSRYDFCAATAISSERSPSSPVTFTGLSFKMVWTKSRISAT